MSESTDSPGLAVADVSPDASGSAGPAPPRPRLPVMDLVRVVQGLYFVFWGMLLTVLVGAQMVVIYPWVTVTEMFLAAGVMGTLIGTWRLYQARGLGEFWRGRTQTALAWAALMTYFCAIFYLWRRVPDSRYLQANAVAFPFAYVGYLIAFNRAAAVLSTPFDERAIRRESHVYVAAVVVLLLLPMLVLVAYVLATGVFRQEPPEHWLRGIPLWAHNLILITVLVPVALTLSLAWGAKDTALHLLASLDRASSAGRPDASP